MMNAWIIDDGDTYRIFVDKTGKMARDEVLVRVSELLFPDNSYNPKASLPGRSRIMKAIDRQQKKTRRTWIKDALAKRLHASARPSWEKNITDDTGLFTLNVFVSEPTVELK